MVPVLRIAKPGVEAMTVLERSPTKGGSSLGTFFARRLQVDFSGDGIHVFPLETSLLGGGTSYTAALELFPSPLLIFDAVDCLYFRAKRSVLVDTCVDGSRLRRRMNLLT